MESKSFRGLPTQQPPLLPLAVATAGLMGTAIFAWLLVSVGGGSPGVLVVTTPVVVVGAVFARVRERWLPFFIGAAITLVPSVGLAIVVWAP